MKKYIVNIILSHSDRDAQNCHQHCINKITILFKKNSTVAFVTNLFTSTSNILSIKKANLFAAFYRTKPEETPGSVMSHISHLHR